MDQTRQTGTQPAGENKNGQSAGRGRSIAFQVAAVALTLVSALAGTGLARWLRGPETSADGGDRPAVVFPGRALVGWNRPDLVLVLSGQQLGYLLPCGCSRPQVGGLERRYNLIQMMKEAGWNVVGLDLGDIPQRHGPAGLPNQQGMLKYIYSMKALKLMGYRAVGFGETEVHLGLANVLAEYALNEPVPRVLAGNLLKAEEQFPGMTAPWTAFEAGGIKVGVTAVAGTATALRIKELTGGDRPVTFENTAHALNRVVKEMTAQGVTLPVLLYQGPLTRTPKEPTATEAMACARAYPQFPLVVCLSDEDDAPSRVTEVTTRTGTKSKVITLGKRGKYVGVVGLWKTGNAAQPLHEPRYERVEMIEELETPKGKEKGHAVLELMEAYTRELKDKNYLEKYGQVRHALQVMPEVQDIPGTPKYVGSAACQKCHRKSFKIWEKTPHAHGYQTLVDATRPSNRQYDPECIVCHTVGFGYQSGFVSASKTPHLKDVGCESCHGPSSLHVANPNDVEWQKRINPWRHLPKEKRKDAIDQFCQKCHDMDNDVTWLHNGFERKWPKVKHFEGPDPLLEKWK